MKLNFFKLNRSRRFNYTPRYYKGKEEASVFHSEGRLVNYRDTYYDNDRRKIWEDQRNRLRNRKNKELNNQVDKDLGYWLGNQIESIDVKTFTSIGLSNKSIIFDL